MKLKFTDILLILAAILVIASVGYNIFRTQSGTEVPALVEETATNNRSESSKREITKSEEPFSDDPEELRAQLRNADREEVLRYMRQIMDRKLPEDYEFPDFLVEAGSGKESARVIGERYPEFYGLGGSALINAVKQYPVKYQAMIEESRAYRELYKHEVEGIRKAQEEEEAAKRQ